MLFYVLMEFDRSDLFGTWHVETLHTRHVGIPPVKINAMIDTRS